MSKITIKLWFSFFIIDNRIWNMDRHCKVPLLMSQDQRASTAHDGLLFFNLWVSSLHKCILNSHNNYKCHGLCWQSNDFSQVSLCPTAIIGEVQVKGFLGYYIEVKHAKLTYWFTKIRFKYQIIPNVNDWICVKNVFKNYKQHQEVFLTIFNEIGYSCPLFAVVVCCPVQKRLTNDYRFFPTLHGTVQHYRCD